MKDLTKDSIVKHIVTMAAPIAIGMITQMAYQLVDLYFVTRIGVDATAGVNTAGNATFILMALTQVLGVGTVALIAHAVGRKDQADANLVFNQSLSMSVVIGLITMTVLYIVMRPYLRSIAADEATIEAGTTFMYWLLPGFTLMFPMTAVGSALRGTGIVQPTVIIQMLTVVINAILAPILIAGWVTGVPLGVKGAAIASSISIVVGVVLLGVYFHNLEHYVSIQPKLMRPQWKQWRRMLNIGLPAGGEFALMFLYTATVYLAIRNFGASAQAGFGIGSRVLQAILLPAMAIAFAAGPIAGQNFGARNPERVRETFRKCALIGTIVMVVLTIFAQWRPRTLVGAFNADEESIVVAALFLQLISWNFVAQGLIFTCSSMFQGLGNTVPSLISSASRLFLFAIPVLWLSTRPDFRIEQVWYLSIASATLQAMVSLWLLRRELDKKLQVVAVKTPAVSVPSIGS
jgi:putative MATE family efflux protein